MRAIHYLYFRGDYEGRLALPRGTAARVREWRSRELVLRQ